MRPNALIRLMAVLATLFSVSAFAQAEPGDFATSYEAVPTSCQFGDQDYVPDGSFTVTVGPESGGCADDEPSAPTYTISATPVSGSGPNGSNPPFTTVTAYIGFQEGDFLFGNAGAGEYDVTVTMSNAEACSVTTNPKEFTAVVPEGFPSCDPVTPVPAMSNWSTWGMILLLGLGALIVLMRRRTA